MINSGEDPRLHLLASYAFRARKHSSFDLKLGETLVGQAALEKERILLTKVPSDYVQISSGLGEATPLNLIVLPVLFEGQVKAVIELASFETFSPTHLIFLDQLTESIGIVLNTIEANMRTEDLLKQSQSLAKELQSQQEELQKTNLELEDKARLLAEQNVEVEKKNMEVEQARRALEEKAAQLALTSKYKSEFLANMSHELRTPLNSLLILSDQLCTNKEGNLSGKQVEFAKTIHSSGQDLLRLINDILDLAKIESGTVSVEVSDLKLQDLKEYVERTFQPIAEHKKLNFSVSLDAKLPRTVRTDAKRLQQILKNLLSNAFKFTERGQVTLELEAATTGWSQDHPTLNTALHVVAYRVRDSGIGIPPDKQQIIFEAFQQADGSTNRKYGGTGLGLSISREIARLLGGEIQLSSVVGEGSIFTLYLPGTIAASERIESGYVVQRPGPGLQRVTREVTPTAAAALEVQDDRDTIRPDDKAVLIIEDDPVFATQVLEVARSYGFKGVVASRGSEALQLARKINFSGITLDIMLPDIDGRRVLHRLKDDPATRHVPVMIVSASDTDDTGLKYGALSQLMKPLLNEQLNQAFVALKSFIERPVKNLLLVEDNDIQRQSTIELIGNSDVHTYAVATGGEGLRLLKEQTFDCIVLDLGLPDMTGSSFIEQVKAAGFSSLPIVVHTGRDLPKDEVDQMKRLARTVILKDVQSPERLFDETALFLHRNVGKLPADKRLLVESLHKDGEILAGKRALIVDDDMRNIFAMTSFLERYDMQMTPAETGLDALKQLEGSEQPFDVVLMDIMMPDMDGYETMRRIRALEKFRDLPILALTAKAMKGDKEKCIEAGASDYIAKPVDTEHLLSLLRIWLHR